MAWQSRTALAEAFRRIALRDLPNLEGVGAFDRYQLDPAGFFRDVLGIPTYPDVYPGNDALYMWEHQVDYANAVAHAGRWADHPVRDRTAITTCHATGKDFSSAKIAAWFLLSFTPSIVVSTAPTDRQTKTILWGEIHRTFNESKTRLPGELNLAEWKLSERHYAVGFTSSATDPSRYAGYHQTHILFIVDEASGVSEPIYEAIEGGLSTGDARLLLIGNPLQSSGQFYRAFHEEKANWKTIQMSAFDSPNFGPAGVQAKYFVMPQWVEGRRKVWGEDSALWDVRVLGRFPTEGTDTLIPLHLVDAAVKRTRDRDVIHEIEMGVDPARFGDDETATAVKQGGAINYMEQWQKKDLMQSAHRVKALAIQHKVRRVKVEVTGLGAGIYDRLVEMQSAGEIPIYVELMAVDVAEKAREVRQGQDATERFGSLRDELWFNFAQAFRDGEICELPDDPVLHSQLTSVKYGFDKKGRLVVESKEDMKKRGLGSPDRADSLVIAFAPSAARLTKRQEDAELVDKHVEAEQFFGDLWRRSF